MLFATSAGGLALNQRVDKHAASSPLPTGRVARTYALVRGCKPPSVELGTGAPPPPYLFSTDKTGARSPGTPPKCDLRSIGRNQDTPLLATLPLCREAPIERVTLGHLTSPSPNARDVLVAQRHVRARTSPSSGHPIAHPHGALFHRRRAIRAAVSVSAEVASRPAEGHPDSLARRARRPSWLPQRELPQQPPRRRTHTQHCPSRGSSHDVCRRLDSKTPPRRHRPPMASGEEGGGAGRSASAPRRRSAPRCSFTRAAGEGRAALLRISVTRPHESTARGGAHRRTPTAAPGPVSIAAPSSHRGWADLDGLLSGGFEQAPLFPLDMMANVFRAKMLDAATFLVTGLLRIARGSKTGGLDLLTPPSAAALEVFARRASAAPCLERESRLRSPILFRVELVPAT